MGSSPTAGSKQPHPQGWGFSYENYVNKGLRGFRFFVRSFGKTVKNTPKCKTIQHEIQHKKRQQRVGSVYPHAPLTYRGALWYPAFTNGIRNAKKRGLPF